jgi:hypothetical protein
MLVVGAGQHPGRGRAERLEAQALERRALRVADAKAPAGAGVRAHRVHTGPESALKSTG